MAVFGYVYFCPDFGIYHYHMTDEALPEGARTVDHKFTSSELEDVVAAHVKAGDKTSAQVVAAMTGHARLHPHKVVNFSTEKGMEITDPEPYRFEEEPKVG